MRFVNSNIHCCSRFETLLKRGLFFLAILILPKLVISQTILPTNSSPTGFATAPVGWTILSGTTDISNKDFWGGISPWAESTVDPPNGHEVWVSGYLFESVGSTISDLTIDESYTMSFYMCELRYSAGGAPYDGTLEVTVGGEIFLFPFTGGFDPSWSLETFTFTATAETMDISFNYEETGVLPNTWCVSFGDDVIESDCDTLDTEVSAVELCEGEEVTLSATSLNDGIVTWDGGVTNGVPFTPPVGVTTYTATSDFEDDCTFSIDITVSESPAIEIVADETEICEGNSIIFEVIGDAETFTITPDDITIGEPYFPEVGTLDVVLTGANGICETINSIEIIVNENPTVDALVDDATICIGESAVFTGAGADTYTWDLGVINGEVFTPDAVGTEIYTVTGIDDLTGCSSVDSVGLTVYDLPEVAAFADDDEVCAGDLVTLTGSGAATFEWDLGVEDGLAFEPPLGTTTYTVIGTSFLGCENSATIEITVVETPLVIAIASDSIICLGEEITFNGFGADDYEWDFGITDGEPFVPAETGTFIYTVIGTNEFGCDGADNVELTVIPAPIVTASARPTEICFGENITFLGSGPDTFSWDGGITHALPFTTYIPG